MTADTSLIDTLAEQERTLVFPAFDEETALSIGDMLVRAARAASAPVIINIRTPDRTLFHAALPGSSPDNDHWARRKSNTALRLHRSSMWVGENNRLKGRKFDGALGIDPLEYADHGGSFPVRVKGTGVIGAITVSGLASAEDHAMIVTALKEYLAAA